MAVEPPPADDSHTPYAVSVLRASDADRERVAETLRVAAGDGRLTLDELDERLEAALSARTRGELAALTADLHAVAGQARSEDLVRITKSHGDIRRKGRWTVPRRMEIRITAGDVTLDFTEAEITHDSLHIDIQLDMRGALILVIKPGIVVDAESGCLLIPAGWPAGGGWSPGRAGASSGGRGGQRRTPATRPLEW